MIDIKNIKHFSFDLWFTLIKSNPTFKKERALYFYKNFNSLNKSIEEVEAVFRNIDLMCNAINEKTGKNIDADEMHLMVIYQLNNSFATFANIDTDKLYTEMEKLIFNYIPIVFNNETASSLDKIKQTNGNTLNILSNTAFIKGSTLKTILNHLELSQYFDFQIYSDEVGVSKPNTAMYKILLDNIYTTRKNTTISLNQILHIGDNLVADIYGAKSAGIHAYQINTNDKLISNLFN